MLKTMRFIEKFIYFNYYLYFFLMFTLRVELRCNSLMESKWHWCTNDKKKINRSFSYSTSLSKF